MVVEITAALVQELRKRTNVGMMECKKALVAAGGDIDLAVKQLKDAGALKAEKKSDRITAEGLVAIAVSADRKTGALVEVNCETDFVARSTDFQNFCAVLAKAALDNNVKSIEDLAECKLDKENKTITEYRLELISKLGENITLRRMNIMHSNDGMIAAYAHGSINTGRIAALVHLTKNDVVLGADIAMQVTAMNPLYITREELPASQVAAELEIVTADVRATSRNKPEDIIQKMITGKLDKALKDFALVTQNFFKNPDLTIQQLLDQHKTKVVEFVRFEMGEGIQKKEDNFVAEVMAQVRR